ncbi:hypothetical protein Asppvi_002059 [Aspergillus pseudoviridinutans]|uniref:Methyltransferase domain-containing protein n=1 Tax=Aspergillus pseudoviridinutans TaxID=1517512 RepID=A0A9P3B3Y4_9EURO|nr:uncharacterized protein Asppvi_002059 [Aspergillus pseudoviridinutans]GIJ83240.1 hypothetical protein Asppvi_002059 [Aspergillus pseudoviridinutans]
MTRAQDFEQLYQGKGILETYKVAEKITPYYAQDLVDLLGLPKTTQRPLVVLDLACATGVIADVLHATLASEALESWKLTCGDISAELASHVKRKISEHGWLNTSARVMDAQKTELPSAHFTHVFVALGGFFPNHLDFQRDLADFLKTFTSFPDRMLFESSGREDGLPSQHGSKGTVEWLSILEAAVATIPGNLPFPTTKESMSYRNAGWDTEEYVECRLKDLGQSHLQLHQEVEIHLILALHVRLNGLASVPKTSLCVNSADRGEAELSQGLPRRRGLEGRVEILLQGDAVLIRSRAIKSNLTLTELAAVLGSVPSLGNRTGFGFPRVKPI